MQAVLDALSSPIRREILWLLWDQELPAGEIAAAFEVTAPTISSHLAVLRDTGLVAMRADGNFRRYRAERAALREVRSLIQTGATKWIPNDSGPEPTAVRHTNGTVVRVAVEVALPRDRAFPDFVDGNAFGRWLGVPVVLDDGRFAATMAWGTRVRGQFEVIAPPALIALQWDFEDDTIPVPGGELVAYVRFIETPAPSTVVEVTQLLDTVEHEEFLHTAWGFVLGRYAASVS